MNISSSYPASTSVCTLSIRPEDSQRHHAFTWNKAIIFSRTQQPSRGLGRIGRWILL